MSIRIAGIYEVSDAGQVYSGYDKFAKKHGHPFAVLKEYEKIYGHPNLNYRCVEVLALGKHEDSDAMLAIVKTTQEPFIKFIIDFKGLKDIDLFKKYIVIKSGVIYPTFNSFAVKHGHPDAVLGGGEKHNYNGRIVRIILKDNHTKPGDAIVAIVETVDEEKYVKFMIDIEGLKAV
jgi:hypothetical protein